MPVETATYLDDLNPLLPGSSDPRPEGDNHIRLLKLVLQNTFPNLSGAVTANHTELNRLDGVTGDLVHINGVGVPSAPMPLRFFTSSATGGTIDYDLSQRNLLFLNSALISAPTINFQNISAGRLFFLACNNSGNSVPLSFSGFTTLVQDASGGIAGLITSHAGKLNIFAGISLTATGGCIFPLSVNQMDDI